MYLKAQQIIISLIFCCAFKLKAQQNIIPNSSFEDTLFCDVTGTNFGQFKNWYKPTLSSVFSQNGCNPDYLGANTGYNCITTSSYYMGTGEQFGYIANTFLDTLKANVKYCFKMHLKIKRYNKYGSNNLGIFMENNTIFYNTYFIVPSTPIAILPFTIIDTTYQEFSFLYSALGGETDIMVGGYMPYASAYYPLLFPSAQEDGSWFVYDDFSLVPTAINLGTDTTICTESDSLLIGEPNWVETNYKWYVNGVLTDTLHGQLKVKPTATTIYVVQKQTSCTTTYDTLVVSNTGTCPVLPTDLTEPVIPNVFTPNGDDVNDYWKVSLPMGSKLKNLEVYNRWGNIVFESEVTIKPWFGSTSSGEPSSEGVYFYVLKYMDTKGEEHKINGYISLFR